MNTDEALKLLQSKGWDIHKINRNLFVGHNCYSDGRDIHYTGRELVKVANCYTSYSRSNGRLKRIMKEYEKEKNRAMTRDAISHEEFDRFSKNKNLHKEDIWYHD